MAKDKTMSFSRSGGEWEIDREKAKDHVSSFARNSGNWTMVFQIGTPNGRYEFTQDPFWVKEENGDGECPSSFDCPNEFEVSDQGKTRLKVQNKNDTRADYRYQLNVWDRIDQKHVPIDPILSNGGHD
ncbi:MAG: hypothetical protein ABIS39_01660 [Sphingomicrobium sp.]